MPLLQVYVVDDHPIFRAGLVRIIASDPDLEVCGEAGDGTSAWDAMHESQPDVAVLDIDIPKPNGLELARRLSALAVPVVILTMYKERNMFDAAMAEGVRGYVLKENAAEDVIAAIKTVAADDHYLTPSINHYLLERRRRIDDLQQGMPGLSELTPTERRVLKMVARNLTSKEIASDLYVSPRTVETHRSRIAQKLGVTGVNGLLHFAIKHRFELE